MKSLVTYSQNREDLILSAFFNDDEKGFYVDVGAHHPINDSVTKLFYDKGWRGINFEPQKELFITLNKNRKEDINLQIGVGDKAGTLKLRSYESSGLSTFSEDQKKKYEANPVESTDRYKEYEVEINTLANVFKNFNVRTIQFLKVDVEGYEYAVLSGNDWRKYRPEVICIEANHVKQDWRPLLKKTHYSFVLFDGLNEYYVAEESTSRIALFKQKFPQTLVSAPIITKNWKDKLSALTAQLENVQSELNRQSSERQELREQLNELNSAYKTLSDNTNQSGFLLKKLIHNNTQRVKYFIQRVK